MTTDQWGGLSFLLFFGAIILAVIGFIVGSVMFLWHIFA